MKFTLFTARCTGNPKNCEYPDRREATDAESLAEAVQKDYVCGEFKGGYRSKDAFIGCDCLMMDCDNDHSENPEDWITPEKFAAENPDLSFAAVPSRNNMKEKNGKAARPRHHYFFECGGDKDAEGVAELKKRIQERWPFFDANALDAARFSFGAPCGADEVFWQDGWMTAEDVMDDGDDCLEDMLPIKPLGVIPNGQRNRTLSRFAGRILKRYGVCDRAKKIFLDEAEKCETPLPDRELGTIWGSAVRFYKEKVSSSSGYVPPGTYNDPTKMPGYLRPEDYSDVGEAKVFVREYGDEIAYTPGTEYLRYDGRVWVESKEKAVGAMEEFLDLQLDDAMLYCAETKRACRDAGFDPDCAGKAQVAKLSDGQLELLEEYLGAKKYYAFVMKRRDYKYITSTLHTAKPMLEIPIDSLDADPYLLNTPAGTYDLRKGMAEMHPHDPHDYITKITKFAPSDEGKDLWEDQLEKTFLGNAGIMAYTQEAFGSMMIGRVDLEELKIAHGDGRNGKSTVCNSCAAVAGTYSGTISADMMTTGVKRNVKPEMAEMKGKRMLIAGELEEGMRLSTSIVKQLCSTDPIQAAKKFKAPFDFIPTHSILLYTNHLPRVTAMDDGSWRRLVVIPFHAKFEGDGDKKNYTRHLIDHAGGYILKWLIEGARMAYEHEFHIPVPPEVKEAIEKYRGDNDWLGDFISECCDLDDSYKEKSGDFYKAYRSYCADNGEYIRDSATFYSTLEQKGFIRKKKSDGSYIFGLQLNDKGSDLVF